MSKSFYVNFNIMLGKCQQLTFKVNVNTILCQCQHHIRSMSILFHVNVDIILRQCRHHFKWMENILALRSMSLPFYTLDSIILSQCQRRPVCKAITYMKFPICKNLSYCRVLQDIAGAYLYKPVHQRFTCSCWQLIRCKRRKLSLRTNR